jgi:hypothetical protein
MFVSSAGASAPRLCSAGFYQPERGQTSCLAAPKGTYAAGTGNSSATLCPAGFYQPNTSQTSCLAAPVGTFVSVSGASSATPCTAGSYQPDTGQTSCIPAAIGYYVAGTGQVAETACPAGQTTASVGSTSAAACIFSFGGFMSPLPKGTLQKSASTIPVKFVLTDSSGHPIGASTAAALAAAGSVEVTLAGAGISPQGVLCSWAGSYFQCNIKTPKGLQTGTSHPYTITVSEKVGTGFVTAPTVGSAVNPEPIYFK